MNIIETTEQTLLEKLKEYAFFKISYYAKKHKKIIFRNAMWTDKCKINNDKGYIVYYDVDAQGYRTATDKVMISINATERTKQ